MSGSGSPFRILAVDDDPFVLRLLSQMLSQAGYEVLARAGARDGLKALEAGGISLLITDLNMPDGSGLDLARDLRGRDADTPVILLSGSIDDGTVRAAEALGRVTCMNKPLDRDALLARVRQILGAEDPD